MQKHMQEQLYNYSRGYIIHIKLKSSKLSNNAVRDSQQTEHNEITKQKKNFGFFFPLTVI